MRREKEHAGERFNPSREHQNLAPRDDEAMHGHDARHRCRDALVLGHQLHKVVRARMAHQKIAPRLPLVLLPAVYSHSLLRYAWTSSGVLKIMASSISILLSNVLVQPPTASGYFVFLVLKTLRSS